MADTDSIRAAHKLLASHMATLSVDLQALLASESKLIQDVTQHVLRQPGKQLRPMLVLLAAGATGAISPQARRAALLVTLLHQASLVHDDVVDGASQRRGQVSVHAGWDNRVALLFGDYLLTKGLHFASKSGDYDLLALLTETALMMSEGEMIGLEYVGGATITEEAYERVIYRKTAHLMGTSMAMGAVAAGGTDEQVTVLRGVGEDFGMAFQLQDDVTDYGVEDQGKPLGLDLHGGYCTLPLIHALRVAPEEHRQEMAVLLQDGGKRIASRLVIRNFVRQYGGIAYACQRVRHYQQRALTQLATVPQSSCQQSLIELISEVI